MTERKKLTELLLKSGYFFDNADDVSLYLLSCGVTLDDDSSRKWVSVKDRMPEEKQLVLGFTGTAYRLALYSGNNRWYLDYFEYSRLVSNVFTHWMPLPKPPELTMAGNGGDILVECR